MKVLLENSFLTSPTSDGAGVTKRERTGADQGRLEPCARDERVGAGARVGSEVRTARWKGLGKRETCE